jgi:hypothetical protein
VGSITAKSSDLNSVTIGPDNAYESDGYVPKGIGIGGGDYVEFDWCLDCGQIQHEFPVGLPKSPFEDQ